MNIIGKWSENTVSEIEGKYDGVKFLGYVEVLPVAIINTVMIVPILIGSGIRMKILEACATGVPVVSTTIGAEGLPLENGRDCFIADSPEAFVDAIKQLDNEQLRKDFIESAQKMINREYSIQALHDNRIGIYYDQV